jgi:hypothetical protein
MKEKTNSGKAGPAPLLAVLLIASALLPATYVLPPIVSVVHSLVRIGQYDPPVGNPQAELYAARGECESFQAVIRAPSRGLTNVNVSATDLLGPNGGFIPSASLELYREQYVYVARGSKDLGGSNRPRGPGWYPDGLIPFVDPVAGQPIAQAELKAAPFDLTAGRNQPIWVDVCIPRERAPGQYSGTLTVTSDQGVSQVPILVHVWNFELPLKPSLQTAFTIFNDTIAQPSVSYSTQRSNQEMLIRHRIMPIPVNPQDEREFIDKLGLNIAHLAFYPFATWGNCHQPPAPSVAELQAQKLRHQPDIPAYLYVADEISDCTHIFPVFRAWARNARAAGVLSLLTAIPLEALRDDGSGTGRSVADIWVLLPKQFVSNPADVAAVIRKKDQVWSYTALVQDPYSPKWAIDFDPINHRILGGFLNQSQGVRGLLYWAVNSWAGARGDPWVRIQNLGPDHSFPPGEGMLVYPGGKVGLSGFAPSMRLKWIRDSVEDFEYVEILKQLGREDWALATVRAVAPDWNSWTRDPVALEAARRKLGQEIHRLSPPEEHSASR